MDISVIIVNYNTFEYTRHTVVSVLKELENSNFEIIIVDNNSKDRSGYRLKRYFKNVDKIRVYKANRNLGFSKANNLGFLKSTGKYVLFLNSDTFVKTGGIVNSLAFLKNLRYESIVSCKLVLKNSKIDHACKRGFPTVKNTFCYLTGLSKINPKKFGGYNFEQLDEDDAGFVDCVSGAFMLMKRETFEKLSGFDEDFFMYGEDIDLCFRAKKMGIKIVYYPEYEVIHYKKKSRFKGGKNSDAYFYKSMWIFYKKHYFEKSNLFLNFIVFLSVNFLNTFSHLNYRFQNKK